MGLHWAMGQKSSATTAVPLDKPYIFTALQEQLGLKLESRDPMRAPPN
jgi:uncharacterized protein (TIGR03435 family)